MKKIIITNGTGGAGKDTFCNYVTYYLSKRNYNAVRYSYVDLTRNMLSEHGIDTSNKTDKDRKLLAGVNKLLEEYDNIPFKDCCLLIDDMLFKYEYDDDFAICNEKEDVDIVLLDVREPKTIDLFKSKYSNILTVLIDNGTTNCSTEEDRGVFEYNYDAVIANTKDYNYLKRQAENFVEKFIFENKHIKKVTNP